jgi:hypothetical protein
LPAADRTISVRRIATRFQVPPLDDAPAMDVPQFRCIAMHPLTSTVRCLLHDLATAGLL